MVLSFVIESAYAVVFLSPEISSPASPLLKFCPRLRVPKTLQKLRPQRHSMFSVSSRSLSNPRLNQLPDQKSKIMPNHLQNKAKFENLIAEHMSSLFVIRKRLSLMKRNPIRLTYV
ncbi:hypothetical protein AVEN_88216-1 [Araneus ventricosus]|uniref:Uncharacterized protein n=1 Tax=Araneus ventricosus TaxID=182803 RepID=A0A4Y2HWM9_ARAVE|nr:hypothetical protein AVEN_88216-1 [Araneus ventricosus]